MDLIYTDKKEEMWVSLLLMNWIWLFGKDENDFLLKVDLEEHCCEAGAFVYFQDTEYGGIIDKICPNTKTSTVGYEGKDMAWNLKQQSYSTRCWRGIILPCQRS